VQYSRQLLPSLLGLLALSLLWACGEPLDPPPFSAGDDDDDPPSDDDDDSPEDPDSDGDGYPASVDCDDSDPLVWPGAPELCDKTDNDCDGAVDEEPLANIAWYPDEDGDGYGTEEGVVFGCEPLPGTTTVPGDCDDTNPAIHPGALIDGYDADCDGRTEWRVSILITVVESYRLCIDDADNIIGTDTLWEDAETWNVWLDSGRHTVGFRGVGSSSTAMEKLTGAILDISISNGTAWWSNSNWRYDPNPQAGESSRVGWCSTDFDDADWGIARDFGSWGVPPWGSLPTELADTAASWIWDDSPVDHKTQYFRLEIDLP